MRVELSLDLFPNPPSFARLGSIANLALDGRHRLWVADEQSQAFLDWFGALPLSQQEEWRLILDEGYRLEALEPAVRELVVTRGGAAEWKTSPPKLSLDEAANYLNAPFVVLLEDWRSDRDFLLAVASAELRKYILDMVRIGAVAFENGGGITNMLGRAEALGAAPSDATRLWIMFDGDGMRPDKCGSDAEKLHDICEKHSIPKHRLIRRSIESYLPPPALGDWADNPRSGRRERIRAYRAFNRLSAPQRHHYNMKDGFDQDAKRTDATAGNLYDGLDPQDRKWLAGGFGNDIAKLYANGVATEERLRADESWDELSGMVGKLVELIR